MGLVSANRKLFDHNAGAATGRSWIKQPDLGLVTKNRKVLENATLAASSSSSSPTLSAAALVAAALSTAASSPSSSSTSSSFSQPSAHYRWKSNQEKSPSPLKSNLINQQNQQQQQQLKEQPKNNNNNMDMNIVQKSMPPLRQQNKHRRDKNQEQTNDEKIDSLLSFLDKPVIVPRSMKRRG